MKLKFMYQNWRGEIRDRVIIPLSIWFGESSYHKGQQWFIAAQDYEDVTTNTLAAPKNFAIRDIIGNVEIAEGSSPDLETALSQVLDFYEKYLIESL